jgi:hypothetical protein
MKMRNKTIVAKIMIALMALSQLSIFVTIIITPKPVYAQFATVDTIIGDPWQFIKDIGIGAAKKLASDTADKFLSQFVNKMEEKYRIRSYLYYDQVLEDYYLSNWIEDKIADPDLRQIFALYYANTVSGTYTGLNGGPNSDPNNALIPKLKQKITEIYLKQGGIPVQDIMNPNPNVSDTDYYAKAQLWSQNPQSFTEQNLQGQFAAQQSAATTASQLEIIVGGGSKAGRIATGSCNVPDGYDKSIYYTPTTCSAIGGNWNGGVVDNVRSLITNPTVTINGWINSAIQRYIDNDYDANSANQDFNPVVGSLLGNYLFNKFTADNSGYALSDSSTTASYVPTAPNAGSPNVNGLDIDGDGVIDGYDVDGDGTLNALPDVCSFGGANGSAQPPCKGSLAATSIPNSGNGSDGKIWPCLQLGKNEANFGLSELNSGTPPAQVADDINGKFTAEINAAGESGAQYYAVQPGDPALFPSEKIGLPEFYLSEPDNVAHTAGDWSVTWRCQ